MQPRFQPVCFCVVLQTLLLIAFADSICAAAQAETASTGISYKAGSGVLPEKNGQWSFLASHGGLAALTDSEPRTLLTKDTDPQSDGRFYSLARDVVGQLHEAENEWTLTVVGSATVSTGHVAATSVRLFVPGIDPKLGTERKDERPTGRQDIAESGRQIGYSLVTDGNNHETDEVLLLDFGNDGSHRVIGRLRVPVNIMRKYTLVVAARGKAVDEGTVILTIEGASPKSISAKLGQFTSHESHNDFGLVFGHLTGAGIAEANWQEVSLKLGEGISSAGVIADHPVIRSIGNRRQLFVDDWIIAKRAHLERRQTLPLKSDKNPVLRRDRPWEESRCELYGSAFWNSSQKRFELFYSATHQPYDARLAVAYSTDSVKWTKPRLTLYAFGGVSPTNIVYEMPANDPGIQGQYAAMGPWVHGPTVIYDAHDTNASQRYKMITNAGNGYMNALFSPDGVHWSTYSANPVINLTSDTGNSVLWDPELKKYVLYGRLRDAAGIRAEFRSESSDFKNWSTPQLVYSPTQQDRAQSLEFYGLSVTPYGDLYIGLVWMFPAVPASKDMNQDTPVTWPELAVSRDGKHWERPFAGQPFLPLGPKGSFDHRQIRTASSMTVLSDRILLLYSGSPDAHVAGHKWDIGSATLRLDGFAAMEANEQEGSLLTKLLSYPAGQLFLNAEVQKGGYINVEAIDEQGKVLSGYSVSQCNAVKTDSLDAPITWENNQSLAASPTAGARLRFNMKNARLYSFKIKPETTEGAK